MVWVLVARQTVLAPRWLVAVLTVGLVVVAELEVLVVVGISPALLVEAEKHSEAGLIRYERWNTLFILSIFNYL